MASTTMLTVFIVALAISVLPAVIVAKTFMVGDNSGWTTGFDYQEWAKDKEFKTGDKLVFKYSEGSHTILKVNGTGFEDCIKPPKSEALTTGNDVVTLATPGKKWYICGVGKHCAGGQKMTITVTGEALDSSDSTHGSSVSWIQMTLAAVSTVGIMFFA